MIKLSVRSIDLIICLIIVKSFWTMATKPSSQSIDKDIITLSGKRFTSALMCLLTRIWLLYYRIYPISNFKDADYDAE